MVNASSKGSEQTAWVRLQMCSLLVVYKDTSSHAGAILMLGMKACSLFNLKTCLPAV